MAPRVYADFHNATPRGRIRLNTAGTRDDLRRLGATLHAGMALTLYTDDEDAAAGLTLAGVVEADPDEGGWVAAVDWSSIVRSSAARQPVAVG